MWNQEIIVLKAIKHQVRNALKLRSFVVHAMLIQFIKKQNNVYNRWTVVTYAWRLHSMKRLTEFFRGVAREMRKVSWPKTKRINEIYNCCYFNCSHYVFIFYCG